MAAPLAPSHTKPAALIMPSDDNNRIYKCVFLLQALEALHSLGKTQIANFY